MEKNNFFIEYELDLFLKHLSGFDFAAARNNSAVPVHFRNIKHIKNPILKLRYVVEVVFPGKEFMVEKYNKLMVRSALPLGSAKNDKWLMVNGKIRISWRFLYCYRWYVGLKGLFKMVND